MKEKKLALEKGLLGLLNSGDDFYKAFLAIRKEENRIVAGSYTSPQYKNTDGWFHVPTAQNIWRDGERYTRAEVLELAQWVLADDRNREMR